jgi:hypothetical protein
MRSARWFVILFLLVSLVAGCGQPQVAPGNRRLVESLRTAISSKRTDWLDANAQLIEERHADGELSDDEYQTFSAIVELARGGDWAAAEKNVIALVKGQKPMPEDLERLKARKSER